MEPLRALGVQNVAIVGAGPVGTAFANAIASNAQFSLLVVASRRKESAELICSSLKPVPPNCHPHSVSLEQNSAESPIPSKTLGAAKSVDLVIVSVSDRALSETGSMLVSQVSELFPSALYVCHTSGALPSTVLQGAGKSIFSLHPAAPFPRGGPVTNLVDVLCAVSGPTQDTVEVGEYLARVLGMVPFRLSNEKVKGAYHAACCMAANFTAVAVSMALACLESSTDDLDPVLSSQLVGDLSRRAATAVQRITASGQDSALALTGPVARGDSETVNAHLHELISVFNSTKEYIPQFYADASRAAVELLDASGSDTRALDQLRVVLSRFENRFAHEK